MSTLVEGATVTVTVSACVILSAGTVRLSLTARQGSAPGTWQYNLSDGTSTRAGHGRIASQTSHLDVLRHAASICAAGYQPGTIEHSLLEQFAAAPPAVTMTTSLRPHRMPVRTAADPGTIIT